ncbi:hypothetical protein FH972_005752 [Carpinus fangiana]|uniref:Uncharacterized protein n=1 Tax=Carpinus fangiana TaxID=176857 RepID=A0A5N6QR85_9ROSI|nr:hypothetical protein FH972_005752 [Carpinus fangiana]
MGLYTRDLHVREAWVTVTHAGLIAPRPCTHLPHVPVRCSTATIIPQPPTLNNKITTVKNLESLLDPIENSTATGDNYPYRFMLGPAKLGKKWREYQVIRNWEGLLDPLDENLHREILKYVQFVNATYKSFDFDPSSLLMPTPSSPEARFSSELGFLTGYRLTKDLRATSGIKPKTKLPDFERFYMLIFTLGRH